MLYVDKNFESSTNHNICAREIICTVFLYIYISMQLQLDSKPPVLIECRTDVSLSPWFCSLYCWATYFFTTVLNQYHTSLTHVVKMLPYH